MSPIVRAVGPNYDNRMLPDMTDNETMFQLQLAKVRLLETAYADTPTADIANMVARARYRLRAIAEWLTEDYP